MKCPTCQNEMAPGYLYCGGATIDWVREDQAQWKKFLTIGNLHLADFQGKIPGFQCSNCGVLLISHEKLKAQEANQPPA